MLTAKECLLWLGSGNGYGYGCGIDNGNGHCGNGCGYGCGNGGRIGDGNGSGDGCDYGNGGIGYGIGCGPGTGNGYSTGDGYGYGHGDGKGNDSNGTGHGYGDGNDGYGMPHPFYKVDDIWCKFLSIHGNYARVLIADLYNTENCVAGFIAKDGDGNFAHGATLREARDALMYKIGIRDTTPYKSWKITDVKTKAELIKAYRIITGACEFGTMQFCNGRDLPDKATVADAIKITAGQYGAEIFKEFFNA